MPKLRRRLIVCTTVMIIIIMLMPAVSAWWWTNNPPGFSHQLVHPSVLDGEARGEIVNKGYNEFSFLFFTGGPLNNPEQIVDVGNQVCVWSIYYELEARISAVPPIDLTSNIIELHGYLYIQTPSGWNQVGNDWMCAQNNQPGTSQRESGCVHLYYNQHDYQQGEIYQLHLNFTAAWYDDSSPPNRIQVSQQDIMTYYEII